MSAHSYILTESAKADIREILRWSKNEFGNDAAVRYNKLLLRAFKDIGADPSILGSSNFENTSVRIYHLRHSRGRVNPADERVGNPRHFVVYHSARLKSVDILRILHDSMDLEDRLSVW